VGWCVIRFALVADRQGRRLGVRKKLSIALIAVGVVVGVFAIVWWQVIAPQLVKLPSDIETSMDFEGSLTLYVDSDTGTPLASGAEQVIPLAANRTFAALPDLFTSGTAYFEDTMTLTVGEQTAEPQVAHYAIGRATRKCVESEENWALTEDNQVDRAGDYGPLFPPGLGVGDRLSVYYDDPARAFEVVVAERIEDWNGLGITVLKIDASRPSSPYDPEAAEVLLVRGRGLPTQISLHQIRSILTFNFNRATSLPFGQYVPAGAQVPEAVRTAVGQIDQTLADHPLTVSFNQESSDFYFIEQATGATVGATFDRTTTMIIDTTVAAEITTLLGQYTSVPVAGPQIAAALDSMNEAAAAYSSPITAFTQNMSMTEASQTAMAQEAKQHIGRMDLVRFWIPLGVGMLAALIVLVGGIVLAIPRRVKAEAK
jgi:hypothetical protein